MNTYLFIGEKPSNTALANDWKWEDGHLAAKQLFDALYALGIDPKEQWYANICDVDCIPLCHHARGERQIVSMGKAAHLFLSKRGIVHKTIVHPAARGSIRNKAVYTEHVRLELGIERRKNPEERP